MEVFTAIVSCAALVALVIVFKVLIDIQKEVQTANDLLRVGNDIARRSAGVTVTHNPPPVGSSSKDPNWISKVSRGR